MFEGSEVEEAPRRDYSENPREIWDQVCTTTDPNRSTKEVRIGSRKFTSVCPTSQLERATELWGPEGSKWGPRDVAYEIDEFGDGTVLMSCTLDLHYPGGVVESVSAAEDYRVPLKGGSGWRHDKDARKKARTAAISKALSRLGFNADIYLGKFEDVGYVNGLREDQARRDREQQLPPIAQEIFGAAEKIGPDAVRQAHHDVGRIMSQGGGEEALGQLLRNIQEAVRQKAGAGSSADEASGIREEIEFKAGSLSAKSQAEARSLLQRAGRDLGRLRQTLEWVAKRRESEIKASASSAPAGPSAQSVRAAEGEATGRRGRRKGFDAPRR